ncbi:Terminase-like family protein [Roseateles sp. YR242]|uniref:terminase large subunit domain-containing protein n=1 Tax=Roseateles sp. YR242 TaxID=1855305 RepID=UPI0008CCB5C1|nr:terminase family protein [Roseateles sp. YR242]SEL12312.1 Terminase-like family protein [Roseateles sp. YR242]
MPKLNVPQAQFLQLDRKYKALVAGFGSGKTWTGCADLCKFAWEWPGVNGGYFAPTYPLIRDIFFPTMEEVAYDWGLDVEINQGNNEVHVYANGHYRNTVICRSMEKPASIVGFKVGKALVDELDVMVKAKAEHAWRKIIARMRYNVDGLRNDVSVTTTPEGYKFVFEQFVKQVREKPGLAAMYGLVQASTYQNAKNLPADYIPSLLASYPPNLIKAYIRGEFVNLASGNVYANFDRKLNHTDEEIKPGEPLHIGMDFNVMKMAAGVSVVRGGEPRTLGELAKVRDTPEMVRLIKERYQSKGHSISVYPDASGQNTSSKNASESDLSILRAGGFNVVVNGTNPAVKDRINSVEAILLNAEGQRRWKINTRLCPVTTESLEQQAWDDKGEPDKKTGHDHMNDANGYFIVKNWPVVRRAASSHALRM